MKEQKPDRPLPGRDRLGEPVMMHKQASGKPEQVPGFPAPRTYTNPPPSKREKIASVDKPRPAGPARRLPVASRDSVRKEPSASRLHLAQLAQSPEGQAFRARVRLGIRLTLLTLVVLLVLGGIWLYQETHALARAIVVSDVRGNPSWATPLFGGANVLIIGVDERPDTPEEGVRGDTMILARLNGAGQWVSLLSLPRDTQVELPDVGTTKMAVAYSQGYERAEELFGAGTTPQQGGMALSARTMEQVLKLSAQGIRIDYTMQINFAGFVGLIDALGGVTIDVPTLIQDYEYPTPDFGTMYVEFQPGPQHMDGATALIYARTRHADSDFGRAERQQQVIMAILQALKSKGWTGRMAALDDVVEALEGKDGTPPPVLTTMPVDRVDIVLGMGWLVSGLNADSIVRVPVTPENVGAIETPEYNLIWDEDGIRERVHTWLRGPTRE